MDLRCYDNKKHRRHRKRPQRIRYLEKSRSQKRAWESRRQIHRDRIKREHCYSKDQEADCSTDINRRKPRRRPERLKCYKKHFGALKYWERRRHRQRIKMDHCYCKVPEAVNTNKPDDRTGNVPCKESEKEINNQKVCELIKTEEIVIKSEYIPENEEPYITIKLEDVNSVLKSQHSVMDKDKEKNVNMFKNTCLVKSEAIVMDKGNPNPAILGCPRLMETVEHGSVKGDIY